LAISRVSFAPFIAMPCSCHALAVFLFFCESSLTFLRSFPVVCRYFVRAARRHVKHVAFSA
jgi:hypothetical protein